MTAPPGTEKGSVANPEAPSESIQSSLPPTLYHLPCALPLLLIIYLFYSSDCVVISVSPSFDSPSSSSRLTCIAVVADMLTLPIVMRTCSGRPLGAGRANGKETAVDAKVPPAKARFSVCTPRLHYLITFRSQRVHGRRQRSALVLKTQPIPFNAPNKILVMPNPLVGYKPSCPVSCHQIPLSSRGLPG